MKKHIFTYFILFSFVGFSQSVNKVSMGLNLGGQYFVSNTTHAVSGLPITHVDLSGRYMLNSRFGLKLGAGMYTSVTLGLNYYFGKASRNSDWNGSNEYTSNKSR